MITLVVEVGTTAGDQFVAVFQSVEVVPVHVVWACREAENSPAKKSNATTANERHIASLPNSAPGSPVSHELALA